jgi:phenylacetate-CoA ligase
LRVESGRGAFCEDIEVTVYARLLQEGLLPLHNFVRRRKYVAYRRSLEESQWWPRERLLELQWAELAALLKHAFETVPYYRRKYAAAGIRLKDIRSRDDFAKLPPLTRQEVNEHREELRSETFRSKLMDKATGGSSGVPTRFYITMDSYDWRTAASERAYSWTGCRLGERSVYLWGAPVGKTRRLETWKVEAYHLLNRQLYVNTFVQSERFWQESYDRIRRFRPRLLVGFVSSVEQFCRYLQATGQTLEGIHAVITAAEMLSEPVRAGIERMIGAPVFNTYGSREFMSIAGECDRHRGLHVHSENLNVETALPPSAGPSEILVTDLHNYGMPFLRYAIGDTGVLESRSCDCGRGLPLLRSIDGRVFDVLRTRDGRVVPGEFFPHLLKEIPEIKEFQIEQKSLEKIILRVVLSAPPSQSSRDLIASETNKMFGTGTSVGVEEVDRLPRLTSGKRRVTIGLGQQQDRPAGMNERHT